MYKKVLMHNSKRVRYDEKLQNKGCPFCSDVRGNNYHIKRYSKWIVVANQYPFVDYALLIVPRRHIEYVFEVKKNEWKELNGIMVELSRLWTTYQKELATSENQGIKPSFNFYVNNGPLSGQSIEHLHWHFIPRLKRIYTAMELIEDFQKVKITPRMAQVFFKKLLK